jgi:hypothetical protein
MRGVLLTPGHVGPTELLRASQSHARTEDKCTASEPYSAAPCTSACFLPVRRRARRRDNRDHRLRTMRLGAPFACDGDKCSRRPPRVVSFEPEHLQREP